jgi:hypothetical protein
MKFNMIRTSLFIVLSVIGVSAQASVIGYSNLSLWQTAVTTAGLKSPSTITFDGQVGQAGNGGSTLTVSGVSFTSAQSTWYVLNGNYSLPGAFYSHQNNSLQHDILVNFSSAVGAISFGAEMLGNAQNVLISLSNGDSFNFTAAGSNTDGAVYKFGSFVDSNPFTSMHIVSSGAVGFNIDNFSVANVAAVPVPAAVWLFGSALAGFIGFNCRKQQAA